MALAKKSNRELMNEITAIKEENEKLEEQINFLRMENFDYNLKCNHLENVLANVNSITKNCAGKLLEASDNICQTIQLTTGNEKREENQSITQNVSGNEKKTKSKKQSQSLQKTPPTNNKAHVVNPHMVNGHVLYVPTINLTRVPNLQTMKPSNRVRGSDNSGVNNVIQESSNDDSNETIDAEINVDPAETNEEDSDQNQLSTIAEASEASTSSARSPHSTLLSGTFQEVKIYLNQVGADSHKEESRKSPRKTFYSSKNETTSPPQNRNSRSGNSLGSVTLRKRN